MEEETYKDMPSLIDVTQAAELFDLLESLFKTPTGTTPVTRWVNATNELVKTIVLRRVSCGSEKEVVRGRLDTSLLELFKEISGQELRHHLMKDLTILYKKNMTTMSQLLTVYIRSIEFSRLNVIYVFMVGHRQSVAARERRVRNGCHFAHRLGLYFTSTSSNVYHSSII